MGLRFVFGASGSGKTEYLYRRFLKEAEDRSRQFFLIVPEQDSLQTQQGIVSHAENAGKGILNIDVLSFNRLAYRVFEEQGVTALHIIDDMGKMMILRSVAEGVKEELSLYKRQLNKPGFLAELKSQISELYQYRITPELLDMAAEHAATAYMRAKLQDLCVLYRAFRAYLSAHGFVTQEEVLDHLLARLPDSQLLRNAVLAFDGFSDFTMLQLDIMRELLLQADEVLCTIVTDDAAAVYEQRGVHDLFHLSRQTVAKLSRMVQETGESLLPAVDLNRYDAVTGAPRAADACLPRFRTAPQLDCLQRHLFRYTAAQCEAQTGIAVYEAEDQRAEMAFIAAEIARCVREEGLRYRDIGIIVTEPEAYRDIIYQSFRQAAVPYFLDDGKSLMDSPYAEFMRAALELVDEQFSYEAVMRALRALPGRTLLERQQLDRFDNFLRARGIRGLQRFSEVWEEQETERQQFIQPFLRFHDAVSGRDKTVAVRLAALRELLAACGAAPAVQRLAEQLAEEGELSRAAELRQSIEKIQELLARLEDLLGQNCVSLSEFRDILDAGLAEAGLTLIPATLDQVIIGDLTRSRFAAPKRFFVAGVNADQIPKAEAKGKILSDKERALFRSLKLELAPSTQENALLQRFYLYRALLNPSEKLVVTYPLRGRGGRSLKPSALVGDLLKLFPALRVQKLRDGAHRIYTEQAGLSYLAKTLPELMQQPDFPQEGEAADCLRVLSRSDAFRPGTLRLLEAAFTRYTATPLDRRAAELVYGAVLNGSITRIELFHRCAYAHFLKYGLQLAERKQFEVQAADIGNLYHAALEHCFRQSMQSGSSLADMSDEALQALALQCVAEAAEQSGSAALKETARSRYILEKTGEVTKTTLWALAQQLRRGDFQVHALERDFDLIEEGIRLRGRIDRIDVCETEEGKLLVKVIDYKSGRTVFDLNQIYDGLQLQLAVYMDVALKQYRTRHPGQEVLPAAMFYYHIDDPLLSYDAARSGEDAARARLSALNMDGLVNTDFAVVQHLDREIVKESDVIPVSIKNGSVDESKRTVASTARMEALMSYVQREIRNAAERIRDGEIQTAPVQTAAGNACKYCPYHAVCGFDKKVEGFAYRRGGKRKPEDIWTALTESERT